MDLDNEYTRVLLVAALMSFALFMQMSDQGRNATLASVKMPALSLEAQIGRKAFEANCMKCHGKNGMGSDKGPPLIHKIYEPNHHSDFSFYQAAKNGVSAHHWPYGDMPAIADVTRKDVTGIIRYIREIQRVNGVF